MQNKTFGRLLVIEQAGSGPRGKIWVCRCACGSRVIARGDKLREGRRKSCGSKACTAILHPASKRQTVKRPTSKRPTSKPKRVRIRKCDQPGYPIWRAMIRRCQDKTHVNFSVYGARGIKVCDRWLVFENWVADMGARPDGKTSGGVALYSIDRIDNSGDYEPGNCRWATATQQNRNRRDNKVLTIEGETLTMVEHAERVSIPYHRLRKKIAAGMDPTEALRAETARLAKQSTRRSIDETRHQ